MPAARTALLFACLLVAVPMPVRAEEPGALVPPRQGHHLLAGDELRFGAGPALVGDGALPLLGQVARNVAFDLVAIPANVANWDRSDVALFTGLLAGVSALMVGPVPLDVTVQEASHRLLGRPGTRFTTWNTVGDIVIWSTVAGLALGTFVGGWYGGEPALVETVLLALEAFSSTELLHLVCKLLLGREGPKDGEGLGVIWGPARSLELFPAGTPSGHAASLYAVLGVVSEYWQRPWLTVLLHAVGVAVCATLLVDDYHFASDIAWGASMGWLTGQWVVRHRSSRFRNADGAPVRVTPLVEPRTGTVALAIGLSW